MQIVIDISEEDYDTLINHNDDRLTAIKARLKLWESLKQGTLLPDILPDTPTNEDMIKDVFPTLSLYRSGRSTWHEPRTTKD